jgi:hypothetical protein
MAAECSSIPVPLDRLWFLRIPAEDAEMLKLAHRMLESERSTAIVELRRVASRGRKLEVFRISRNAIRTG